MKSAFYKEEEKLVSEYNELLSIYGKATITLDNLMEINKFHKKFEKLKKLHIDGDNYKDKVKGYYTHRKSLLEDYGYEIPKMLPFDSPHELKLELDKYLVDIGLEPEQVSILTKEILSTYRPNKDKDKDKVLYRRPRKKDISPKITVSKDGLHKLIDNITPTRLRANKEQQRNTSLPQEIKDDSLFDKVDSEFGCSYNEAKAIVQYINEHYNGSFKQFLQALLQDRLKV